MHLALYSLALGPMLLSMAVNPQDVYVKNSSWWSTISIQYATATRTDGVTLKPREQVSIGSTKFLFKRSNIVTFLVADEEIFRLDEDKLSTQAKSDDIVIEIKKSLFGNRYVAKIVTRQKSVPKKTILSDTDTDTFTVSIENKLPNTVNLFASHAGANQVNSFFVGRAQQFQTSTFRLQRAYSNAYSFSVQSNSFNGEFTIPYEIISQAIIEKKHLRIVIKELLGGITIQEPMLITPPSLTERTLTRLRSLFYRFLPKRLQPMRMYN